MGCTPRGTNKNAKQNLEVVHMRECVRQTLISESTVVDFTACRLYSESVALVSAISVLCAMHVFSIVHGRLVVGICCLPHYCN